MAEYVIITTKNDELKQKEIIDRIYFDHIENVLKTSKKTLPHLHNWSSGETQQQIESIKKRSRFFDSKGETIMKAIPTNPSQLVRKIFANKLNIKSSELLKIAYDQYELFSKFEHFGELSFDLTHKGYDDNKIGQIRSQLHVSIQIIIAALKNYSTLWDEDFEINKSYFNTLHTEIVELVPEKIISA